MHIPSVHTDPAPHVDSAVHAHPLSPAVHAVMSGWLLTLFSSGPHPPQAERPRSAKVERVIKGRVTMVRMFSFLC